MKKIRAVVAVLIALAGGVAFAAIGGSDPPSATKMKFGGTVIPNSSTAPTNNQCLLYTGGHIAGGSCGSGANVSGYYFVSRATNAPTNAVNFGALTSGLLKHTVSGSISSPATATAGTDYMTPIGWGDYYANVCRNKLGFTNAATTTVYTDEMTSNANWAGNGTDKIVADYTVKGGALHMASSTRATGTVTTLRDGEAWCIAVRLTYSSSKSAGRKCLVGFIDQGGRTSGGDDDVVVGFNGDVSTTKYSAGTDIGMTADTDVSTVSVDNNFHDFYVYYKPSGDATHVKFSVDAETEVALDWNTPGNLYSLGLGLADNTAPTACIVDKYQVVTGVP